MTSFLTKDFLLHSDVARELCHDYAPPLPIYDHHSHLPPPPVAANEHFAGLPEVSPTPDT